MGPGRCKTMLKMAQAIMALLIMQNNVYHYVIVVDFVKMQVNNFNFTIKLLFKHIRIVTYNIL